jgi:hypothetical protein
MSDYYNNIDHFIELIDKCAIKGEDLPDECSKRQNDSLDSYSTPLDPSFSLTILFLSLHPHLFPSSAVTLSATENAQNKLDLF